MSKLVGWNIFLEYEREDGTIRLEEWDISEYIANMIDEDYHELKEEEE
tara:strand:- start:257 stop:400 length:144 start_codon:yes stop_codon:yes gene_type:complete